MGTEDHYLLESDKVIEEIKKKKLARQVEESKETARHLEQVQRIKQIYESSIQSLKSINEAQKSLCEKKHRLLSIIRDEEKQAQTSASISIPFEVHENLINIKDKTISLINNVDDLHKYVSENDDSNTGAVAADIESLAKEWKSKVGTCKENFEKIQHLLSMTEKFKHLCNIDENSFDRSGSSNEDTM